MNPSDIRSAQFIDTFYPMVDGVVQAVNNYAAIMNRDAYTCVVTPKGSRRFDDSVLPYDVIRTAALNLKIAEYTLPTPRLDRTLKSALQRIRPDIFHVHSPFTEGSFARDFARKLDIPCVATFHSKYYDDVVNVTGSKTIAEIVTSRIVKFYESVDSVWSVTEGAADVLRGYGYRGDIVVMENGTTYTYPANADAIRRRAAEEFSIPQDKRVLLFVGHLIWHKNLRLILDTFRLLTERSDKYRLLIVGDGYDEKVIRAYADELDFPERSLRFLGRINDRELLMGVYLNSNLFFFPSVYDTSGLVVREAASLGIPSLLTAGSNAAEVIEKDMTGFTAEENAVSMYREIVRIFHTEGLLERAGVGARANVARTWEQLMPQVRHEYARIIEDYRYRRAKEGQG